VETFSLVIFALENHNTEILL